MRARAVALLLLALPAACPAVPPVASGSAVTEIAIDAGAERHPISPLIYGSAFADPAAIADLGLAVNRAGGDSASLYDWRHEARGAGRDWYFESLPIGPDEPSQYGTRFVAATKVGGAAAMLTVPMIGWSAKLAPGGCKNAAFAISKYGAQQASDTQGLPDAGNGFRPDGTPITGNDPHDAATPATLADSRAWIDSLVARWGRSARGGVRFYALDNEPSRWHDIHRDVHPIGLHADELARDTIATARMIHAADPTAKVVGPEEWGWNGYRFSGFDQQMGDAHGYSFDLPDRRTQIGGLDLIPWLLSRWKAAGHPVDIVSLHYYPQGGEYGDDVSPAMQLRRNRSTRGLWDRSYTEENWIADRVALIPRLRGWVDRYYDRGTPIAITEYSWGAEGHMNGATAQADILGIFGREELDMATRWATPARGTPVYLAMKLFRNYDNRHNGFGETSVAARAPDPDSVASFAALRKDGALTIVAINKRSDRAAPVALRLSRFGTHGTVSGARLVDGRLVSLPQTRYAAGVLTPVLPPQSVTLFALTPDER